MNTTNTDPRDLARALADRIAAALYGTTATQGEGGAK